MNRISIASEKIQEHQLEDFQFFLEQNKLPAKDINLNGNFYLRYYDSDGNTIGTGGLELYGTSGLLRSVAVSKAKRGNNIGNQIVDDILQQAKDLSLRSVFLLTETAHAFFLKKGFSDFPRDDAPDELQSSSEFSQICPTTAKCMVYRLN